MVGVSLPTITALALVVRSCFSYLRLVRKLISPSPARASVEADLILTLTNKHKKEIYDHLKLDNKRIFTLREFAGEMGDIEDPSMKGIEGFRKARDEIINCIDKGLKRFE